MCQHGMYVQNPRFAYFHRNNAAAFDDCQTIVKCKQSSNQFCLYKRCLMSSRFWTWSALRQMVSRRA